MPETATSGFRFLRYKPALIITCVLLAEITAYYVMPTKEYVPTPPPLQQLASSIGPWRVSKQTAIDDYIQSLLKADDSMSRDYVGPGAVELFVAFFKSQRSGVTPHSPKVCLPGNGWTPEMSGIVSVTVPGEPSPIPVNRYVVSQADDRRLVYYWYQNAHRVMANEYLSKFYLVFDSLRFRRSDEALIRVTTEAGDHADPKAEEHALQFIRDVYQPLKEQMWLHPATSAELRLP